MNAPEKLQIPSMQQRVSPEEWQTRVDLAAAYRSREFLAITNKHFAGYSKPDYQQALQTAAK